MPQVFTFLLMEGDRERMEVMPIGGEAIGGDESSIIELFTRFDCNKAQCFLPRDRQRLLGVIEASFGDMYRFNSLVRHSLTTGSQSSLALGSKSSGLRDSTPTVEIQAEVATSV